MSKLHKARVISSGMVSAVGGDTKMNVAAVNCGINAYSETIYINKKLNPIKAAWLPEGTLPPLNNDISALPRLSERYRRMVRLTNAPLAQCLQNYSQDNLLPLFMSCPESLPGVKPENLQEIIHHIKAQSDAPLDIDNSRIFATGRAGGLHALEVAFRYFESTGAHYAIVGGVETCMFALQHIASLDRDRRTNAAYVSNGYAPGEASAFVLLVNAKFETECGVKEGLKLYSPGFGEEPGNIYSDQVYRGEGLDAAFKQAILHGPDLPISTIYSSMNGENFWAKEYAVACTRNHRAFVSDVNHEHPADCFGDIGAAYGPLALGLIARRSVGNTLLYCSSDSKYRAAVYVANDKIQAC